MRAFAVIAAACLLTLPYITLAAELGAPRQLLQGVRQFNKVAQHKTPQAPRLSRKTFDSAAPKRMLLEVAEGLGAVIANSRSLLQGKGGTGNGSGIGSGGASNSNGRVFSDVAQHKQPRAPRMTRKNFDRQVPL